MIEKQREKEFLFELERLYYNFNLTIVGNDLGLWLHDIGVVGMPETTKTIEEAIDYMKDGDETMAD